MPPERAQPGCARDVTVPVEGVVCDLPLIDHHCHGAAPGNLDPETFEALMSQSYRPAPQVTTWFNKPIDLMFRGHCAPLLDLEPFIDGEANVERHRELGAGEVAGSGVESARFPQAFCDTLASRAAGRTTFAIDQTPPSVVEVKDGTDAWYRAIDRTGRVRFGLWSGAEIARDLAIPLQIHVGFGDPDITMHTRDPTHFTEFLRAASQLPVPARGGLARRDLPQCLLRRGRDPQLCRTAGRKHHG